MKRFVLIGVLIAVILLSPIFLLSRGQANKIKLFCHLLFHSLEEVRRDYAARDCSGFSATEIRRGSFDALVTGYCKPRAENFANRQDFLCAVGLNCSCPNGRDEAAGCAMGGSLVWSPCHDFDDQNTDYCHQTASQSKPQAGTVAADWHCFPQNSTVTINGQDYQVTDRGAAITGRRFDIWFDNCQDAFKVLGIYQINF